MRWGILPASSCAGFVAYRMDTPVSESETLGKLIMATALRFLGWGSVAVIIMLYATDDMTIEEPNLRFTLVGTAFFVIGLLGRLPVSKRRDRMTSCSIPCDYIPNRSYSLVRARELMVDLIAEGNVRSLKGGALGMVVTSLI